jgi:DNA-binding MarR family transcriptional regulator
MMGFRLSTATVLFHTAVADRLGLNVTDLKCYSLILRAGTMTAGELAGQTGLTTGAITGVVDRLEKAGLARRVRDAGDRRRVIIEPVHNPAHDLLMQQLYGPMGKGIGELVASFSDEERQTIFDFVTGAITVLENATHNLRRGSSQ